MATRRQHFVTFYSPGSFVPESSTKPIENIDPAMAVRMGRDIVERYGAKPHSFMFSTSIVADEIPDGEGGKLRVDSKEVWRSGRYFLGGKILSYEDVMSRDAEGEEVLRSNMRANDIAYVVENRNSYKSMIEFDEGDVIVDAETGAILQRGDDPERKKYREAIKERHK